MYIKLDQKIRLLKYKQTYRTWKKTFQASRRPKIPNNKNAQYYNFDIKFGNKRNYYSVINLSFVKLIIIINNCV